MTQIEVFHLLLGYDAGTIIIRAYGLMDSLLTGIHYYSFHRTMQELLKYDAESLITIAVALWICALS